MLLNFTADRTNMTIRHVNKPQTVSLKYPRKKIIVIRKIPTTISTAPRPSNFQIPHSLIGFCNILKFTPLDCARKLSSRHVLLQTNSAYQKIPIRPSLPPFLLFGPMRLHYAFSPRSLDQLLQPISLIKLENRARSPKVDVELLPLEFLFQGVYSPFRPFRPFEDRCHHVSDCFDVFTNVFCLLTAIRKLANVQISTLKLFKNSGSFNARAPTSSCCTIPRSSNMHLKMT